MYEKNIVQLAREYALEKHKGLLYSGYDYSLHLQVCQTVAAQYMCLLDVPSKTTAFAALWLHDVMEDCGVRYKELETEFGKDCADIVYNVTNELGRNRIERLEKTYPKIQSCRLSTWVKLCDRIANVRFSYFIYDEMDMFLTYKKEYPRFKEALYNSSHGFDPMWEELSSFNKK